MKELEISQKLNKRSGAIVSSALVFFISMLCFVPAYAQDVSEESDIPIEEIPVIGKRSLSSLEFEVKQAEDFKYALFNELNSTDAYDITCKRVVTGNTRIRRRSCDAGYMQKARDRDIDQLFLSGAPVQKDQDLAMRLSSTTDALNAEMIELALKHPELAEAMIRANDLGDAYVAARREQFKTSFLGKFFFKKSEPQD